jgi:hypothetical protein
VGVGNFFDFPLFLIVDDDWQRRGLEVSGDWNISSCCGFQQRYVKYWMDLHAGGKVQFICFGAYLFEDGIGAYKLEVELIRGAGCLDVFPL